MSLRATGSNGPAPQALLALLQSLLQSLLQFVLQSLLQFSITIFIIGIDLSVVISIGIGNHALVATATGETVNCGNGFTPVAALNFFRDIESIRAQCAQQNSKFMSN